MHKQPKSLWKQYLLLSTAAGKSLLLKATPIYLTEHGEIVLVLNYRFYSLLLVFMLPEDKPKQWWPGSLIHQCNSGTRFLGVTNHFLTGFKAHSMRRIQAWCCSGSQNNETRQVMGKANATALMKEHDNKMTLNSILLSSWCLAQLSSEVLHPAVGANKHRGPQLDSVREWETIEH